MRKVKYTAWKKIVDANKKDAVSVSFPVKDGEIIIDVNPRIPYSEQMEMVGLVIAACSPANSTNANENEDSVNSKRSATDKYLEGVWRLMVLTYYTNLDFSDQRVTTDIIWDLAGDDEVYNKITAVIDDPLYYLWDSAYKEIDIRRQPTQRLASRVLGFFGKLDAVIPNDWQDEINKMINDSDGLGLKLFDAVVSTDENSK